MKIKDFKLLDYVMLNTDGKDMGYNHLSLINIMVV